MKFVFFDLDGTVADTEILKAKALELAVRHFGSSADARLYRSVMGRSWEEVTRTFFDHAKIDVAPEDFNLVFREKYAFLIDQELVENKFVSNFIEFLKSREIRIALVSSASPWMVQKVLAKLNLEAKFDLVVTNADVDRHKPHPDGYLLALKKLAAQTEEVLVFEDSESGFAAAKAAGLTVYGIKHTYNSDHDFSNCREVWDSFASWSTLRDLREH